MKTYEIIAESLNRAEVKTVFGLMGNANMHYIAVFIDKYGGRFISANHESSSISMADGFTCVTGELGVATVTHGPAFMNALTAITEAVRSRTPLLILTGSTGPGREQLQSANLGALTEQTGAHYEQVHTPETAADDFHRALLLATTDRRPVVLDIPYDLLTLKSQTQVFPRLLPAAPEPVTPAAAALDGAAEQIKEWKRPLILVGRGVDTEAGRREVAQLAQVLGAPITSSVLARAHFADESAYIGICGGLAYGAGRKGIEEADGILVFGSSLTHHLADSRRNLFAGKQIIQVDREPRNFGRFTSVDYAITGDSEEAVKGLVARLQSHRAEPQKEWAAKVIHDVRAEDLRAYYTADWSGRGLSARDAVLALMDQIPDSVTMVSDLGRYFVTAWRHLPPKSPGTFMHAATFGAIGLGLGTALGAAIGEPTRPTILLVGDGGLMLSSAELHTAVREKLPLVILLFNDSAYGSEYTLLEGAGLDPKHSLLSWPDISKVAQAMGYQTLTAANADDLSVVGKLIAGIQEGDSSQPLLVNIKLDPTIDNFEW